jgi:hypothetical protein
MKIIKVCKLKCQIFNTHNCHPQNTIKEERRTFIMKAIVYTCHTTVSALLEERKYVKGTAIGSNDVHCMG